MIESCLIVGLEEARDREPALHFPFSLFLSFFILKLPQPRNSPTTSHYIYILLNNFEIPHTSFCFNKINYYSLFHIP